MRGRRNIPAPMPNFLTDWADEQARLSKANVELTRLTVPNPLTQWANSLPAEDRYNPNRPASEAIYSQRKEIT